MRLLIIRHAIAAERGTPGLPDDERPLTPEGEKRFQKAAKGLARIVRRPDVLFTSPLVRARRTAEIAAETWGRVEPVTLDALAHGDDDGLQKALASRGPEDVVVIVGHEPHVSALLGRLLGSTHDDRLAFRKGGAALVELSGRLAQGGHLVWFLPPKTLRALAD